MKIRTDVVLLVAGALFCARAGWGVLQYQVFQSHPDMVIAARRVLPDLTDSTKGHRNSDLRVLGKLEIPRLGLSTLVLDGEEEENLAFAAGHVAGTAALGSNGNAAIAGHRDSSFRALRKIRTGDVVRVSADRKEYQYVVQSMQIVSPDDIQVLSKTETGVLTLITCYPFRYVGSAPKRFVVRAELRS